VNTFQTLFLTTPTLADDPVVFIAKSTLFDNLGFQLLLHPGTPYLTLDISYETDIVAVEVASRQTNNIPALFTLYIIDG
jgi:hypothetical protein